MATQTEEAPMTAAPGEMKLDGPSGGINTLSSDLIAKLNKVAGVIEEEGEKEEAAPKAKPVAAPTKPTTPAPTSTSSKAETTPAAKATAEAKPADAEPKKGGVAQLREAYERAQARLTEVETSVLSTAKERDEARQKAEALEQRLLSAETRISKELEPRVARLTEVEQKLQEREEALKVRDYTATTEWHDRYVKPIVDVQQEAGQLMAELTVETPEGHVPATQDHLNHVLTAPSLNEAAKRATEMFGPLVAPQVVNLRSRLSALQRKQQEALKNAQLEATEWQKRTQADQMAQREQWLAAVSEREKAHLSDVTVAEGDTETAEALARSLPGSGGR